jgi:large subunit ribosomal protein L24
VPNLHLKNGDSVVVISGKSKGKRGKILRVDVDAERIYVEGANMQKKHQKPTQKVMQGGIVEKEGPIAVSAALIWCPKCSKPVRIGHKVLESGKKVRVCVKCGEVLDK